MLITFELLGKGLFVSASCRALSELSDLNITYNSKKAKGVAHGAFLAY
jgi:hypothetical protein